MARHHRQDAGESLTMQGLFSWSSKVAVFTAVMVAVGNGLSALSIGLAKVGQVGLDLSHVATFIAAIYGGPAIGFLTGLLGGIVPGIHFGPLGGLAWLGLIGLPIGKSLTGLTAGFLYNILGVSRRSKPSLLTVPVVLASYVPECLFTIFFFLALVPLFLGPAPWLTASLLVSILVKAWIEVALMSIFLSALTGNQGFTAFVSSFFTERKVRYTGVPA